MKISELLQEDSQQQLNEAAFAIPSAISMGLAAAPAIARFFAGLASKFGRQTAQEVAKKAGYAGSAAAAAGIAKVATDERPADAPALSTQDIDSAIVSAQQKAQQAGMSMAPGFTAAVTLANTALDRVTGAATRPAATVDTDQAMASTGGGQGAVEPTAAQRTAQRQSAQALARAGAMTSDREDVALGTSQTAFAKQQDRDLAAQQAQSDDAADTSDKEEGVLKRDDISAQDRKIEAERQRLLKLAGSTQKDGTAGEGEAQRIEAERRGLESAQAQQAQMSLGGGQGELSGTAAQRSVQKATGAAELDRFNRQTRATQLQQAENNRVIAQKRAEAEQAYSDALEQGDRDSMATYRAELDRLQRLSGSTQADGSAGEAAARRNAEREASEIETDQLIGRAAQQAEQDLKKRNDAAAMAGFADSARARQQSQPAASTAVGGVARPDGGTAPPPGIAGAAPVPGATPGVVPGTSAGTGAPAAPAAGTTTAAASPAQTATQAPPVAATPAPVPLVPPVPPPVAPVSPPTSTTVKAGSTLSQIAQNANTTVAALMAANPNIRNPDAIQAGQTINLPPPSERTGGSVYAGGIGTAAETQAGVESGKYLDYMAAQQAVASSPVPEMPAGGSRVTADTWRPSETRESLDRLKVLSGLKNQI